MNTKQQLNTIYTPFCYLIGWSKYNMFYYGVRYAMKKTSHCLYESGCHPDDFWVTYKTSSKYVKEFMATYGEPDVIQIRRTFQNKDSAIKWESKVLDRIGAVKSSNWLNRRNNGEATKVNCGSLTQQHKKNISRSLKGRKHNEITKEKISRSHINKVRSIDHCINISKSKKGISIPSLMRGVYRPCIICGNVVYQTRYMINIGYIKRTCSKSCKSALTRLNYLRRFNKI